MRLCHIRTKLGKLAIMYLCVRGTDLNHFASVYDIYIELWSCPNVWYFFIFFFILLQHIPPTTFTFQPTRN
jgi:hypothetical protein